jgi:hypothetical protein
MRDLTGIALGRADSHISVWAQRVVAAMIPRGLGSRSMKEIGPMRDEHSAVWINYNGECDTADDFRRLL